MLSMHRTGVIWNKDPSVRGRIVRRVCEAMEREYGQPSLGNPKDPLNDLVYVIVSNATSPQVASRIYFRIKKTFIIWDDVLISPASKLQSLLQPAGLSNVKSQQIRAALRKIRNDYGKCDLTPLREKSKAEIQDYLLSLPGVGEKVAKCVMMYTMDAKVLPVDRHVHRISKRLGWTARKRWDQCHDELEALVPPHRRYGFHVDCVLHGRSVCRRMNPACERCCINRHCEYFRRKHIE